MNEEIDVQAAIPEIFNESEVPTDEAEEPVENGEPDGGEGEAIHHCEDLPPFAEEASDPALQADEQADEQAQANARTEQLEQELINLRAQLAARDARDARIQREYDEFRAFYPDVPLGEISDAVHEQVEKGIPLVAAFALEERKKLLLKQRAEEVNAENRRRSSGAVSGTESAYFSPAEVRAMSQAEVRRNYNLIIESMKSWH